MIKLVEIVLEQDQYHLREIILNSTHIVSISLDIHCAVLHANGKLPEGLHEAQQFSKVILTNGKEMIVVGNPDIIGTKAKNILHG